MEEESLERIRDYLSLIGITGLIIILDQVTKWWVRQSLAIGEAWSPFEWLMPYARILHTNNTGAAFGLFPAGSTLFAVVAVLVTAAILYYYPKVPRNQWLLRLALGLQLAGALGNLIDRINHGTVTDFISVGTFPVFNVADSSISVGTALLIVATWIEERRLAKRKQEQQEGLLQEPSPHEAE
ncbi:MAG TPA: signal peptidase II [Chloroflexi bacterium]|nr:signal peptidase II [Chloroflexota bacterium]